MKLNELSNSTLMFALREYFCCDWSEDDKIFIINANGIDIHHFKPNPKSKRTFPEFDRSFIFPVMSSPSEHSGYDEKFILMFSKLDLYKALSNPLVTPQFSFNRPSPVTFKKASWSPMGVLPSRNCLLAALTCLGSVTIWIHTTAWSALLDVSYLIYLHLKQNESLLPLTADITESLDNIMCNCKQLACSAIAWSDVTYPDNNQSHSYFATAQKSGIIYIWRLIPEEVDDKIILNTQLELQYSCGYDDVCELYWITHSQSDIYLIFGTTKGVVNCLQVKRTETNLEVVKMSNVWEEEDNIAVAKITSIKLDEKLYVGLIVKGTFLISFSMDGDCCVSNLQHKNFGNLSVTSLQKVGDREFYLATLTGPIFYIQLIADDNNVPRLVYSTVKTEINYHKFTQHGLCISRNNTLCLVLLHPCKRVSRFHGKRWSKFYVTYSDDLQPAKHLLQNDTMLLTNQWDILELIRVLKMKDLYNDPQLDSHLDISNCKTLYDIKLCFWLNTIWHSNVKAELLTEDISKQIMARHAQNNLLKLAEKYNKTLQLSETESETISLQRKLIANSNCESLDVLLRIDNLPQIVKHCEWCEEELVYPICSSNHPREFCCITYRDIDSNKFLVCTLCNSVAHIDLKDQNPLCIFCDSRLKYLPLCGEEAKQDAWMTDVINNTQTDDSNFVENME